MSYSIGAMASGLAQGQSQTIQDRRNRAADMRAQQAHEMNIQLSQQTMGQREDDSAWAKRVREREMGQWKANDEQQRMSAAIQEAMLQAEVSGDITGLVKAYNEITGGAIRQFEPTETGFKFYSQDGSVTELEREDVMGFGASLLQPGALTQIQQARASSRADREASLQSEAMKQGEWATDAEGNRSFRMPGDSFRPSPTEGGGREPAEVTTNRYYAQALGITEAEAIKFRNNMSGKTPQEQIMEIADLISNNPREVRELDGASGILQRATEIYNQMSSVRQGFSIQGNQGDSDQSNQQANADLTEEIAGAQAALDAGATPDQIRSLLQSQGATDQEIAAIMEGIGQ